MNIRKDLISVLFVATLSTYAAASFVNGKIYSDCKTSLDKINKYADHTLGIESKKFHLESVKGLEETVSFTRNNPLYYPFGFLYDSIKK